MNTLNKWKLSKHTLCQWQNYQCGNIVILQQQVMSVVVSGYILLWLIVLVVAISTVQLRAVSVKKEDVVIQSSFVNFSALHFSNVAFNNWIYLCVDSLSSPLVAGWPCFCAGSSAIGAMYIWVIHIICITYFIGPFNHKTWMDSHCPLFWFQ